MPVSIPLRITSREDVTILCASVLEVRSSDGKQLLYQAS